MKLRATAHVLFSVHSLIRAAVVLILLRNDGKQDILRGKEIRRKITKRPRPKI